MKKKCIVHIGFHKTGTSSIQSTFYHHLNDSDYTYFKLLGLNHSRRIYSYFTENPEKYHLHIREGLDHHAINLFNEDTEKKIIKNINISTSDNMIISGEGISMLSEQALLKFKCFLNKFFLDVVIVAYVRPPFSHMQSLFQENIKAGKVNSDLGTLYPKYRKKIEKFDTVFGREKVNLFYFTENTLQDNNVVLDFCKRLGVKIDMKYIIRVNDAIFKETLSFIYIYYKYGPGYGIGLDVVRNNNRLIQELNSCIGKTKFSFSPKLLKPIIDKHKEDIAWAEKRMQLSFAEDYISRDTNILTLEDLDRVDSDSVQAVRLRSKKLLSLKSYFMKRTEKEATASPEQVVQLVQALKEKYKRKTKYNIFERFVKWSLYSNS